MGFAGSRIFFYSSIMAAMVMSWQVNAQPVMNLNPGMNQPGHGIDPRPNMLQFKNEGGNTKLSLAIVALINGSCVINNDFVLVETTQLQLGRNENSGAPARPNRSSKELLKIFDDFMREARVLHTMTGSITEAPNGIQVLDLKKALATAQEPEQGLIRTLLEDVRRICYQKY